MNILDVHQYLAETVLTTVAITDPIAKTIAKAYPMLPPARVALADLPCAMMPSHELQETNFRPAWIEQKFAINLQVFVKKAEVEQDIGAQMAAAFLNAIAQKLSDGLRLGGTSSLVRGLRGSQNTIGLLPWAGVNYVGLDLFVDVTLITGKVHAA